MRIRAAILLLAGVIVALFVIAGWQAEIAKGRLERASQATDRLRQQLTAGEVDQAQAALPALSTQLAGAAGVTGGPAWWVAQHVPVLGRSFAAVRGAALAARELGLHALPEGTEAMVLARHSTLVDHGQVDLAVVATLSGHVDKAARAAARAKALLGGPRAWLIPAVARGADQARTAVTDLASALDAADQALTLAPTMLGREGPRRYFVAVQNNAESRATGGLIGSYAIVTANHGRIALERTGSDTELPVLDHPVPSDPDATGVWRSMGSGTAWYDANLTPTFPDAARNLAGLWQEARGQRLDGVLALDPLVLSELLKATGPVPLEDGRLVSPDNVVGFVARDEYVLYRDVVERKRLLSGLAGTLFHRITAVGDSVSLLRALAASGRSGHLFLWSAHPAEQTRLATGIVGGALPRDRTPYLEVVTQNFGGDKLDFYVRRRVTVTRSSPAGFLRIEIRLRNIAPLGLPDYVTVRADKPKHPVGYAQAHLGVAVYGAIGSEVSGVFIDGRATEMNFSLDHGHRLGALDVELPRNRDVVVTVVMSEPSGRLVYRQQPLLLPDDLSINVPYRVVGR